MMDKFETCKYKYEDDFYYDDDYHWYVRCEKRDIDDLTRIECANCDMFESEEYRPYEEKDTKCDLCKMREQCQDKFDITTIFDTRKHYIRGFECMLDRLEEK